VAAVVVAYGLGVAAIVCRTMSWRDLVPIGRNTVRISAMLYLILIGASLFAFVMTAEGVPQAIVEAVLSAHLTPLQFLMITNLILLTLGCIFDGLSMLVVTLPLLFPVANSLDIDPHHLAVLMTVNIEIAVLMPPVGINLFVLSGISGLRIETLVRSLWPFFLFLLTGLGFVTYFPALSTWLPRLMGP
jgi:C4-dicarboxylate transporter, DctM subunit